MGLPGLCSRAFEQIDLVEFRRPGLEWGRHALLTCKGALTMQRPQMDNPLPRISQRWFALDRREELEHCL